MPSMSETAPPMPATPSEAEGPTVDHHQHEVEEKEAYDYWGYLFKQDKTGTDKLKSLLRGLKECMNTQYNTDHVHGDKTIDNQPDLTPEQLAHFYRELNGNYDQLFLGTPSESIAFIYKSLGCLHSLQPQSWAQSTAFTDPTVPSLKTEGWIMWQTIQLLLGPDEHSQFIIEAVQKWDLKDPVTGEMFPKVLPRRCFPTEPDRHMVMWYEGVSERLRKEAEDEERSKEVETERTDVRRLRHRPNVPVSAAANAAADELATQQHLTDDEGSVDSRGPALAYFRNPLYRHVDGRPSIIRRSSKRPTLSPRPTMVDKGKEAAATMGHVIRNIGSPNLWDGPRGTSRHSSRDRRRRSTPDHRHPMHYPGDPTSQQIGGAGAYDGAAGGPAGLSPHDQRYRRRRSSQQPEQPVDSGDEAFDGDESSAYYSPRPTPPLHPHGHGGHHQHGSQQHRRAPSDAHRPGSRDSAAAGLRHSRSHEPTPTQKETGDYFEGYDDPNRRRNSAYDSAPSETPPAKGSNAGGGFGPSASPLFATHVARQPQPQPGPLGGYPPHQPAGRPHPRNDEQNYTARILLTRIVDPWIGGTRAPDVRDSTMDLLVEVVLLDTDVASDTKKMVLHLDTAEGVNHLVEKEEEKVETTDLTHLPPLQTQGGKVDRK
ncbi:hypothetical protein LTR78_003515 [Recurvomyces mirabilis]|uniref:DUF7514 domain-containing protein n=1 Tax=Recurvomyces mirabilis TaxID=574656 RepID=A0AAE0WRZ4_9PEZI|nr:hypothetical protein LTR78_003515 [Recurvomyces mirabilis]KAK5154452.1 hypothetical protein LTS14_006587 [Recurvomyces mirabilis]